ncbi:MAG: hypothetical protein HY701_09165, partial [Gemmatimonadetes bacterium]|nr:hypothetical protein [Gemmatimonadota bacterium]
MPVHRSQRTCGILAVLTVMLTLGACGDEGPGPIDRIELTRDDGGPLEVMKGEIITLKAQAFSGTTPRPDAVIRYRSENPDIATIDSIGGRVVALNYGTAQIAVTANGEFTARVPLAVVGPAITRVVVLPASSGATIGGSVSLTAVGLNAAGDTVRGAEYNWRTTTPAILQVSGAASSQAVATGLSAGAGTVEAVSWNNLTATASVTVLPVRDFTPKEGAPGRIVAIVGSNLAAPVEVAFSRGASAFTVTEVARVASDTIYAWVPPRAQNGPLRVTIGGVSGQLSGNFTVTGNGDDFIETLGGNDEASLDNPVLGVGGYNPALIAVPNNEDWFLVPVPSGVSALTVEVSVRKKSGISQSGGVFRVDSLLHAVLYKLLPPSPTDSAGFRSLAWVAGHWDVGLVSYDFHADTSVSTLRSARQVQPTDTFFLRVLANTNGGSMFYGLRALNTAQYRFGPDAYEENDAPEEAKALTFPASINAFAENGGELDFYTFTLTGNTKVQIATSGATGDLDV